MKRHARLRDLSRDHHHALVLARALKDQTPPAPGSTLPREPSQLLRDAVSRFETSIAPHLRLEERELIPLGLCAGAPLPAHAERVARDHAALRAFFDGLTLERLQEQRAETGRLLEAHVRFEEREWFPALEAGLDDVHLSSLQWRLQHDPESILVGYHRDEQGAWVAELDCGHAQHVRHAPPFQQAAWITTEQGRAQKLGVRLHCPLCKMPRLPPCARVYKESPQYDSATLPSGLLRSHRLRPGTWGQIVVHQGLVHYVLEDRGNLTLTLRPGVVGVVAPEVPHHVEPLPGARLSIRFCRCEP